MKLDDYQNDAATTAGDHGDLALTLCNWGLGLVEEAGEVAGLVKKEVFHKRDLSDDKLVEETGDVLWYLANLCRAKGISLSQVAEFNLAKLAKRYPNGFVPGGGNR